AFNSTVFVVLTSFPFFVTSKVFFAVFLLRILFFFFRRRF
ncbi:MAG: hypothetical protein ACI9Q9_001332, partial [Flavobacterium sp.]